MTRSSSRVNAVCALAALPALFTLCGTSQAQSSASAGIMDLSGPPVMSALWGTRLPRACARLTTLPNTAQAIALIQCRMDRVTRESITLMQNIKIQMGGTHLDASGTVYDLRGSNDYYTCAPVNEALMHNAGKNCAYTRAANTIGSCWKESDGGYQCEMRVLAGPDGRANTWPDQPGPTTY